MRMNFMLYYRIIKGEGIIGYVKITENYLKLQLKKDCLSFRLDVPYGEMQHNAQNTAGIFVEF